MIEIFVLTEVCKLLGANLPQLKLEASFIQNGGDSLAAAALAAACKTQGCELARERILTSCTLWEILYSVRESGEVNASPFSFWSKQRPKTFMQVFSQMSTLSSNHIFLSTETPVSNRPADTLGLRPPLSVQDSSSHVRRPARAEAPSLGVDRRKSTPLIGQSSSLLDFEDELLTEMQLSLIHGTLKMPGMNVINHSETFYSEDIPIMKSAWKTVMEMESIFHASSLQQYFGEKTIAFDWRETLTGNDANENIFEDPDGDRCIGSFFEVVPCKSIQGQRNRSTVTWIVHHALVDGYSAAIILDKVRTVANGIDVQAGPSFWQLARNLRQFQQSHHERGNAFWLQKSALSNSSTGELLLPVPCEELDSTPSSISSDVIIDIASLQVTVCSTARDINVTPAAFFNAAWALVLATYADSDAVVFGAVLSGRSLPLPNAMTVIGPLVNTLPLLVDIKRDTSVKDFILSVFQNLVELEAFQWTTPANGFSRQYESALAVQFQQPNPSKFSVTPLESCTQQHSEIPLSIAVEADGKLLLRYHRHRFSRENIDRLAACYYNALKLLLDTHATVDVTMEGLLSCSSRSLLERYGNWFSSATNRTSVKDDLVTLFEKIAREFPENIAVEKGDFRLTYQALDHAASRTALRLRSLISSGDIVCVHSDRSANWLIAIFGILKAGGVYCSLDSALPAELRNSMFSFSAAKVYLTPTTAQLDSVPDSCGSSFSVESALRKSQNAEEDVLGHRQEPEPWSTAYLCFTSGSTGRPKGVSCTHEGLVAFQSDLRVRLFARPGMRISQVMSVAFDGSIHEVFSALTYGATLVLPAGGDPFAHLSSVDSAILTPSIARVLNPQDYERLKAVYLVGEPVPQAVANKWAPYTNLYNMYGPTEGTCGATIKHLVPGSPVTIGGPNPTSRLYVLNSRRRLAQPSMIGEIYLAGVQIAKGYLNLPDQTKERFLPDSICCNAEQMYKTGDRGYWNEDGEIILLGRNDRQIKLLGYRLDLNDLEIRVAKAMPEVDAVAIARHGNHLIAMVQPVSLDIGVFRRRVAAVLPSYAVPHQVVPVARLPTTTAGKVDYAAVTSSHTVISKSPSEPAEVSEKLVIAAFRHSLSLNEETAATNESSFIDLGGNSLQQLSLAQHLSKLFHTRVPLRMIIECPTIRELARSIEKHKATAGHMISPSLSLNSRQVSPIEFEWLQKYRLDAGSSSFNVCFASSFDEGAINRNKLADAWNAVLARHKILRCRYITRHGNAAVREYLDCVPQIERTRRLDLWHEVNRPFHIDQENSVRIFITKDQLLVVLSHIIADYTTLSILLREASAVYNGQELSPVTRDYFDASVWYESVPSCHLDFWKKYLQDCPSNPPIFGRQQDRSGYQGKSVVILVGCDTFRGMREYSVTAKVSMQQLVTAAVALCLDLESSRTDLVMGSPYINRNLEDLETVGLYLEPLPVRIQYDPAGHEHQEMPETYIQAVQRSYQAALARAMPWHQLLDHLAIEPDYPNHPLFDVMVTFHDYQQSSSLQMSAPGFETLFVWSQGSKFKLMCEFTAVSDTKLLLRLEHDTNCISASDMQQLQALIPQALALLTQGMPYDAMKKRLAKREEAEYETTNTDDMFGTRLCDL